MAYDESLAERIRMAVGPDPLLSERKMFAGICFMVSGNMALGIVGEDLMVRAGATRCEEALALPPAREVDFNGRPMRGSVYVAPEGSAEDAELEAWYERGWDFAESLPAQHR